MTYTKNTGRSYTQSCFPKGFTLIELLVVVLIIGILAAVAVPQYQKAVLKSRLAQWDVMFDAGRKAIDMYLLENGWPSSGEVSLTGKNSVATIVMPGNCNIHDNVCYTTEGSLSIKCASLECGFNMSGEYNADGTDGNTKMYSQQHDGSTNYSYLNLSFSKSKGVLEVNNLGGKIVCEWLASAHPDIPVPSHARNKCNLLGVSLPNPSAGY